MEEILEDYSNFCKEIQTLDNQHDDYLKSLEKIADQQTKEKKKIKELTSKLQKLGKDIKNLRNEVGTSEYEKKKLGQLRFETEDCKQHLDGMLDELPRGQNGAYLSVILGSTLDVSLMNKAAKFRYKDEYEKFKLTVTIAVIVVVTIAYFSALRVTDAISQFLLVWYYCTLTIRESILRVNGSKIKGWWLAHHYVSTVLCGVMLTWPDTDCYREFRSHFLAHALYIAIVQLLQVQYQRGCLRRLRSLGQRHAMDITVDGFHSWMFRGLTFLLPFLCIGYLFQLYIAFVLAALRWNGCKEWQSVALALLFLVVSLGNSSTTMSVIYRKFTADKTYDKDLLRRKLTTKYSSTTPLNPKSPSERIDGATMESIFRSSEGHTLSSNVNKKSN